MCAQQRLRLACADTQDALEPRLPTECPAKTDKTEDVLADLGLC